MCNFRLLRVSNFREHQTKAVFDLKLMVGCGEHKGVVEESGFRVDSADVNWGLNFLSVHSMLHSWRSAGFDFANKVVFVAFIARWVGLGNATQRIGYLTQVVDQVLPAVESSQL